MPITRIVSTCGEMRTPGMQGAAHGLLRGREPELARGNFVEHDGLGGIVLVEPRVKQPARDRPDAVLLEELRADLPHLECRWAGHLRA